MPVTIRELAKTLGLSITTVSRALDGYADVAAETRRRVQEAAQALGYEPSYAARGLRRQRADALGYILPTSAPRFSDPFYAAFLTGLCDEAASRQMDLLVASAAPDSPEERRQYQHWVQARRVDGLVINRARLEDWRLRYLRENRVPFAVLGGDPDGAAAHVRVRERLAVAELVRRLVQQGHRRLAYLGGPAYLALQVERRQGFIDGLQAAGIALNPALETSSDLTEEGGLQAALHLLRLPAPPTALVCVNDLTALGALTAAKLLNLRVGAELAIAGFDGLKETATTHPPLTTIVQPTYEIARQLLGLLAEALQRPPAPPVLVELTPEIAWRESSWG